MLKSLVEPHSRDGLGHLLPLLFWQGYARLNAAGYQHYSAPAQTSTRGLFTFSCPASLFLDHITTNLLPFWMTHSIDADYGGYFTHLNRLGQVYDDSAKYAAMQARLIYAFSVGHALQPEQGYLPLAHYGVNFLTRFFWDDQYGGWFTSVRRDGQVISPVKLLFDQAYVLIGLAEYYRITRDPAILNYINRTWDLLEGYGWDGHHQGYFEIFRGDWTLQSPRKTICIQLDMLRAFLALYEITQADHYRQRALQIADLVAGVMHDPDYGCVLETFRPDWRYSPVATQDQTQVGHNLKGAWLLLHANDLNPHPEYVQAATRMVDFCLQHGWDWSHGGFFQQVYRSGLLASPVKVWWPECEGLYALIALYQRTGEARYWQFFQSLTAFVFTHFVDQENGEWFTSCQPDGTPRDDHKGGVYKSAYHTVQACLNVTKLLNGALLV